MVHLNILMNCSVQDELLFNLTYNELNITTTKSELTKAVGFGTATGILVSLIINIILSLLYSRRQNIDLNTQFINKKIVLRSIGIISLVILLPTLLVLLLIAVIYKFLYSRLIKKKDKYFVSFLDSFDVFWNLEGDSVINILGVIESKSSEALVENIKNKLQNLILNKTTDKIFYRKNEDYGFYYWRRYSKIDVSEYVEIIELSDKYEHGMNDLEELMSDLANQSLPYNNEGLFKILITKQRIGNYNDERGEYAIIFRIHHSVGDGVALIDFLCESLADKSDSQAAKTFVMPKIEYNTPSDLINMIRKLCAIPLCIVDLMLRNADNNTLHGPTLLGIKRFKWTNSDENILTMIKGIKDNVNQLTFSDILVAALSGGLNNYFKKTMAPVPEDVAVIIPARIPKTNFHKQHFTNDFTVSILDVPVKEGNLNDIKERFKKLRGGVEFQTNHYFLKLANILPKQILEPMFYSSHATVVLSGMPGPECLSICGGNVLKRLVFFVPHKGTTGVGVTAFCYGGVLRLAVSADKALMPTSEHLSFILNGMVDEIKRLHAHYTRM
ncbi:uncharacterized protein LOC113521419 [Galleria mellonella]|uniref:Uncharacterized protein LOC113521419 n=1 Tax=Galleria mellonella TaxID=7137 RepID=A0A6J3C8I7_GALME|nr:uncharacterized protein LOC113521419 [Galleria mellonella]